jgi:hypothetical protein
MNHKVHVLFCARQQNRAYTTPSWLARRTEAYPPLARLTSCPRQLVLRLFSVWTSTVVALFLNGTLAPAMTQKPAGSLARLNVVDAIVEQAIEQKQIPGAVVLIGHDGHVVYRKAFGNRALEPRR